MPKINWGILATGGIADAMAKENRCFIMEAMWTRFLPAIVRVREILAKGL